MYCSCYSNPGCYSHGQHRLDSTIAGMTQRLGATSPTSHGEGAPVVTGGAQGVMQHCGKSEEGWSIDDKGAPMVGLG
jgi:hypothetical protein